MAIEPQRRESVVVEVEADVVALLDDFEGDPRTPHGHRLPRAPGPHSPHTPASPRPHLGGMDGAREGRSRPRIVRGIVGTLRRRPDTPQPTELADAALGSGAPDRITGVQGTPPSPSGLVSVEGEPPRPLSAVRRLGLPLLKRSG